MNTACQHGLFHILVLKHWNIIFLSVRFKLKIGIKMCIPMSVNLRINTNVIFFYTLNEKLFGLITFSYSDEETGSREILVIIPEKIII